MGKNGMQPMDANTYPDHWARESRTNEDQGLYAALAGIAPAGRTLEIVCGIGLGTLALARSRPVLSIDNNPKLIALTRQAIRDASVNVVDQGGLPQQIQHVPFVAAGSWVRAGAVLHLPPINMPNRHYTARQ